MQTGDTQGRHGPLDPTAEWASLRMRRELREESPSRPRPPVLLIPVSRSEEIELALEGGTILIFKLSYRCPDSLLAYGEVVAFAEEHPEVPVLLIDVLESRHLSEMVARRLCVEHASPQAILVSDGVARWDASHAAVTRDNLEMAMHP